MTKKFISLYYQIGQVLRLKETQEEFVILDYKQTFEKITNETIIYTIGSLDEIKKHKLYKFDGLESLPEIPIITISLREIKQRYEVMHKMHEGIYSGLWPVKWKKRKCRIVVLDFDQINFKDIFVGKFDKQIYCDLFLEKIDTLADETIICKIEFLQDKNLENYQYIFEIQQNGKYVAIGKIIEWKENESN